MSVDQVCHLWSKLRVCIQLIGSILFESHIVLWCELLVNLWYEKKNLMVHQCFFWDSNFGLWCLWFSVIKIICCYYMLFWDLKWLVDDQCIILSYQELQMVLLDVQSHICLWNNHIGCLKKRKNLTTRKFEFIYLSEVL